MSQRWLNCAVDQTNWLQIDVFLKPPCAEKEPFSLKFFALFSPQPLSLQNVQLSLNVVVTCAWHNTSVFTLWVLSCTVTPKHLWTLSEYWYISARTWDVQSDKATRPFGFLVQRRSYRGRISQTKGCQESQMRTRDMVMYMMMKKMMMKGVMASLLKPCHNLTNKMLEERLSERMNVLILCIACHPVYTHRLVK